MFNQFKELIIGQPKQRTKRRKISKFKGLAILSSDALSSAVLRSRTNTDYIISSGCSCNLVYFTDCRCCSESTLAALIMSYRQIIYAYPKGGGAYMVSKTNLGRKMGIACRRLIISRLHTDCRC